MEGCAGIMNAEEYIYGHSKYYEEARRLATLETGAAVEGALKAGATEVLVVDGHGPGAMNRELLHPRARLLAGRPWCGDQAFGMDDSFAAALIIGQHAKANADGGHISHTMGFNVEDYRLNDISIGETGLWMVFAGHFHVPVILLSGDQAACDEARALVPNMEVAAVKWGFKRGSGEGLTAEEYAKFNSVATHLHPDEARRLIRERACAAVKRVAEIKPFRLKGPYSLSVSFRPERGKKRRKTATVKASDLMELFQKAKKYI
jgi:D-amino peptidase